VWTDLIILLAIAVPVALLVLWQRLGLIRSDAARRELTLEADRGRRILEVAPDGLFMWPHDGGGEACSRRLAVLLDLPKGTDSGFADLLARFPGDAAGALETGVYGLRRDGSGFDLLLPSGRRLIHAVGVRAGGEDGAPVTDLLWMRDVSADAAGLPADVQFRSLLDALPLPIWLRDADLNVAYTNRAGTDAGSASRDLAARARAQGKAVSETLELDFGSLSGLFEVTETPVAGWPGTAGFARAQDGGAGAEDGDAGGEDMEGVLEILSAGIAVFGAEGRLRSFNEPYAEIWGLDREWLRTGPTFGAILDRLREQRRLPESADFSAYKEEQTGQFDTLTGTADSLLHLPDGRTLRALVSPRPAGGLVFAYEDVSERLDLERSYNALTAVQGATLDNLHEGVGVFGSDGRLKLCNPAFASLWNMDGGEPGRDMHIADFVEGTKPLVHRGGAPWAELKERIIASLMSRQAKTGRLVRSDGMVLDYANVPLPDGAVLLSYVDVTDSDRVERALRQRAEAVAEADRLKSEFIANVSYEVRTPLNTIVGFAEILSGEQFGELNRRQKEYSGGILEASRALTTVIGDILDLATIEAGMMALELDTVDLHAMLASVFALVRERARAKSIELEFDCPASVGWIVGDEKRLKQVIFNLLGNAVNFTGAGGRVRLGALAQGDEVSITIADSGVGMAPADRERLFRPFERGPAAEDRQDGAGLGLPLVVLHRTARRHRGSGSRAGQGNYHHLPPAQGRRLRGGISAGEHPLRRETRGHHGAPADLAFDRQRAAVMLEQGGGYGQPQAGPHMAARHDVLHLIEGPQDLRDVVRGDADAGIRYPEGHEAVLLHDDRGCDPAPRLGELDAVVHQVEKNLLHAQPVGAEGRQVVGHFRRQLDAETLGPVEDHLRRFHNHGGDIDDVIVEVKLSRLDPGDVQDIGDQGEEMGARLVDHVQIGCIFAVPDGPEDLSPDHFGKTDDGVQRGPQFVTHVGQELGLRAVGEFRLILGPTQVPGALFDPPFQFAVGLPERLLRVNSRRHVGAGAAEAGKLAAVVEHGLAVNRQVDNAAVWFGSRVGEIAEWPACLQIVQMPLPGTLINAGNLGFLAGFSEQGIRRDSGNLGEALGEIGKAQVPIHFPIPILGGVGEVPKALLVLTQSYLRPLSGRDIGADRNHAAARHGPFANVHPSAVDQTFLAVRPGRVDQFIPFVEVALDVECRVLLVQRRRVMAHDDFLADSRPVDVR
jgi:signal transduction histidine kinase/PAS domain-containing protein